MPEVICDVDKGLTFNEKSDIGINPNDNEDLKHVKTEIISMNNLLWTEQFSEGKTQFCRNKNENYPYIAAVQEQMEYLQEGNIIKSIIIKLLMNNKKQ